MNVVLRPLRWFTTTPLFRSLRFRLILLVLLASLPSLALLLLTAAQQRDVAITTGQEEARRLARLVAADQSSVSSSIETVLGALAISSELRSDDPGACQQMLRNLTSATDSVSEPIQGGGPNLKVDGATFSQVAVYDSDIKEYCAGPAGSGLFSDPEYDLARVAISTGQVAAGNYETNAVGSMVVTYAVPVTLENSSRRVILARLSVHSLLQFAHEIDLPSDAFIVVFSRDTTLEQRYPSSGDAQVGQALAGTPVVDQAVSFSPDDTDESRVTIDGEPYVVSSDNFVTQGPKGIPQVSYAMVGFPESVVALRANDKFKENLGKLGIAGIVALVAAWVGADLFVGRDAGARKNLIEDFYHAFSTGQITELDQVIGPGYIDRTAPTSQAAGIAGLRQNIAAFRTAFPDGKVIVRELIADHDKVVARVTLSGTHVADYFGIEPSGKPMVADGIETFRFMHGMVVESWSMFGDLKQKVAMVEEVQPPVRERRGLLHRIAHRRVKATGTESTR